MARPKKGVIRDSVQARIPRLMRQKLKAIADALDIPIGDVIDRFGGKAIDNEFRKVQRRKAKAKA